MQLHIILDNEPAPPVPMPSMARTQELESEDYSHGVIYTRFAGQGRKRFHYGVAQPILAGSEATFVAHRGRNWLQNAQLARTELILGEEKIPGLRSFAFREL